MKNFKLPIRFGHFFDRVNNYSYSANPEERIPGYVPGT